jgi:hypothetical protein
VGKDTALQIPEELLADVLGEGAAVRRPGIGVLEESEKMLPDDLVEDRLLRVAPP